KIRVARSLLYYLPLKIVLPLSNSRWTHKRLSKLPNRYSSGVVVSLNFLDLAEQVEVQAPECSLDPVFRLRERNYRMTEHNDENTLKAEAWNTCMAPRLESLLGWFTSAEWSEGIAPFLENSRQTLQRQLNNGQDSTRKEDIIRGRLLAIEE